MTVLLQQRGAMHRYLLGSLVLSDEASAAHLQRVLDAVASYLPRRVVRARLADPLLPPVSGELIQATLLFADISGFTAMSEQLTRLGREGAEIITAIVNSYFAAMLDVIQAHGGDLLKFGGDALLVCFDGQGAATRGCAAALAMQRAMDRFSTVDTPQGCFALRMTAALGSGPLFLASLGDAARLEYAVMGPAVEQMARAEDLTAAGQTLIDAATLVASGGSAGVLPAAPGFYRLDHLAAAPEVDDRAPGPVTTPPPGLAVAERMAWLAARLDVLSPYLSPTVLERIVASPGQRTFEGEHRLVTALFANFYGIDPAVDTLGREDPAELTAILNRHFLAMRDVVDRYGGIVNKVDTYVTGHRIVALFGAPVAHEDDADRALLAALDMQRAAAVFGDVPTSAGRFCLRQRVGVNTGYVFAGELGTPARREYSVMGDEVNLASRLMGVAGDGEVRASQATVGRTAACFQVDEQAPVRVKGKQATVRSYRVAGAPAGQAVAGGVAGRTMRQGTLGLFLGRQAELAAGRAAVDEAMAGRGQVLDVTGEVGTGKSHLVVEIAAHALARGMTVLSGAALSYGHNLPYLPWLSILHALFDLDSCGAGASSRQARLQAVLDEADLGRWAPVVGTVLGVPVPDTPLTASLDPQLRQRRFFDIVLQVLQHRASSAPVMVVLDDVQWADALSLDLAAYIARNVAAAPLLLALVHRPECQALPPGAAGACTSLHLDEMDDETSLALAQSILDAEPALGRASLDAPLRHLILERAQGNPLFVHEITRSLIEAGQIAIRAGDEAQVLTLAGGQVQVEVPTTLNGLLMSRIDRLTTPARRTAQVASVVGVSFASPLVADVYPYDDAPVALGAGLAELAERDLVLPAPPESYTFRHTLTQEVAYESLPFARRRELHVRVGEALELRHAADLAERYGVLAHHFERGQVHDKAFEYLVRAGDKARAEFANDAALADYQQALDIARLESPAVRDLGTRVLDVLEAMGDVYLLTSRYDQAVAHFEDALSHAGHDARRRAGLFDKLAHTYEQQGLYGEAIEFLQQGRRVLEADPTGQASAEMVRIYNLLGWVQMRRGETEPAIESCQQGLRLLAALPRDAYLRDEAELYNTLGTVYSDLQANYEEATRAYERSIELRRQANDLPGLARAYNNFAGMAWEQDDLASAEQYLRQSLEISRQIGNHYVLGVGYNNLGALTYTRGDAQQAIEHYQQALALRQRIGDPYGVASTCSNIAESLISLQRHAVAREYLERSAAIFEEIESEGELPEVYCLLARVAMAEANPARAVEHAQRAATAAANTGNPEWLQVAERLVAEGRSAMGDTV